ncbi:hypothetical protein BpHYR1_010099 [Brachionus plicatilis]|uniref:Uncharacterized protein n=1 Tax=Brachionus plicatilis TaxID=10195 RepID=A0A3M7S6X4_BRAPC|nr:hypothetical protein BpHYR1_010099 [Brachionus plicatilis]
MDLNVKNILHTHIIVEIISWGRVLGVLSLMSFRNSICSDLVDLYLNLENKDSSVSQILPTPPCFKFFFLSFLIEKKNGRLKLDPVSINNFYFTEQFRIKIRENFPQNPNETIGFYRSADKRKFLEIKVLILMKELMLDTNIQIDKLLKHSSIESDTPSRSLFMSVSKETEEHGDTLRMLDMWQFHFKFSICLNKLFWFVFKDLRHLESIVVDEDVKHEGGLNTTLGLESYIKLIRYVPHDRTFEKAFKKASNSLKTSCSVVKNSAKKQLEN